MTSPLRRAAVCAGLAACGLSTLAQAQDSIAAPERAVLRRSLPVAAAPIVQQRPNGLYKLSITDSGIELVGPKGGVKITDAGIEIGAPNTTRVAIRASGIEVRSDQDVRLNVGAVLDMRSGSNVHLRGSSAVDITSSANVQISADAGASLVGSVVKLGCTSGKPVARVGDQVNAGVTPAVIVQGSPTVQVC